MTFVKPIYNCDAVSCLKIRDILRRTHFRTVDIMTKPFFQLFLVKIVCVLLVYVESESIVSKKLCSKFHENYPTRLKVTKSLNLERIHEKKFDQLLSHNPNCANMKIDCFDFFCPFDHCAVCSRERCRDFVY